MFFISIFRSGKEPPSQNSLDNIEKTLIPVLHKLHCSNPEGPTTQNVPGKPDLLSINKFLSELYIQHANNTKVSHRLKKVRGLVLEKFLDSLKEI